MEPLDLKKHKLTSKLLDVRPVFKPLRRGQLPRPFHKMGGSRIHATGLIKISKSHLVLFIWRDGQILSDTSFYGHLLHRLNDQSLYPLFEFHWHPSHKGFHAKLPCKTNIDYTNRMLPGAPELRLSTQPHLDPRKANDRNALIDLFCNACGISIINPNDNLTVQLWN